jgi:hypothetical protein
MYHRQGTPLLVVLFVFGCIVLVAILPLSFWTDRTLEYWLTMWKGTPVNVPFWLSMLVTLILNAIILGINVVSEILRLVM